MHTRIGWLVWFLVVVVLYSVFGDVWQRRDWALSVALSIVILSAATLAAHAVDRLKRRAQGSHPPPAA